MSLDWVVSFLIKECNPLQRIASTQKVVFHIPLFQEVDDVPEVRYCVLSLHVRQDGVGAALHGHVEEGVDPRVGEDPRHLLEGGGRGRTAAVKTPTLSVLARGSCKERCFLRDQSIAVVFISSL